MKLLTAAALALPLALATPITKRDDGSNEVEGPTPFVGTGKIGMYHDETGTYMGCATVDGQWTIDETQCAVFTGTASSEDENATIHIATAAGTCGTTNLDNRWGVFFNCGLGKQTDYYRLSFAHGTRILFGDLYFTYSAGQAKYPTGTEALDIHLWGSTDSGKFVQLGWNATSS